MTLICSEQFDLCYRREAGVKQNLRIQRTHSPGPPRTCSELGRSSERLSSCSVLAVVVRACSAESIHRLVMARSTLSGSKLVTGTPPSRRVSRAGIPSGGRPDQACGEEQQHLAEFDHRAEHIAGIRAQGPAYTPDPELVPDPASAKEEQEGLELRH